ncbi:hypothetical protein JRQ81_002017, partial [Phrynocephalus forsythii]
NILTVIALSRLAARTQKSSYWYLLALTASDILTQIFVVFAGFILQSAILDRQVPGAFAHTINVLQFAANHASIWMTVLLTVDRYVAICHPLQYRAVSYPERTQKIIGAMFAVSLATGIPFYWWLDAWHDVYPPTTMDKILKWLHCFIIYFIPSGIFLVTNSVIICKLKRSGGPKRRLSKTTAILLAITTVFIILWAPRTFVMIYHLYMISAKLDWRVHLALDVANMLQKAVSPLAEGSWLSSSSRNSQKDQAANVVDLPLFSLCGRNEKEARNGSGYLRTLNSFSLVHVLMLPAHSKDSTGSATNASETLHLARLGA